ncbi:MAG: hypothetical protein O9301_00520 [Leptospira sp.]|nr:hypothetical protein [Leptospira sp.]
MVVEKLLGSSYVVKINEDEVDINSGELGKRKYIWIYDEQIEEIQPGKTTQGELHKIIGKQISIRISFNSYYKSYIEKESTGLLIKS